MTITQITYERVYNLGNYESERISAVVIVEGEDVDAAYQEAKAAVEGARTIKERHGVALATDNQRNYILTLQDKAGWSSEDMLSYCSEQSIDLAELTKAQASQLIEHLRKEARQEGIVTHFAKPLVTPRKQIVEDLL